MNNAADQLLVVDVGGTKIAWKAVDREGIESASGRFPTPRVPGTEGWCDAVATEIRSQLPDGPSTDVFAGVYFATVGPSEFRHGRLHINPPNIASLQGRFVPYPDMIASRLSLPYGSANDGHCMLAAELAGGALRGEANAAALLWSSGVGGAVCRNGQPVYFKRIDAESWDIPGESDHDGNSPEWGHWIVETDPKMVKLCNDGAPGHLEGQIGGSAMEARGDNPIDFHSELMSEGLVYLPRALATFFKTNGVTKVAVSGTIGKTLLEHPDYDFRSQLQLAFAAQGASVLFEPAVSQNPSLAGATHLGLAALQSAQLAAPVDRGMGPALA